MLSSQLQTQSNLKGVKELPKIVEHETSESSDYSNSKFNTLDDGDSSNTSISNIDSNMRHQREMNRFLDQLKVQKKKQEPYEMQMGKLGELLKAWGLIP